MTSLHELQSVPFTQDTRIRSLYYRFNGSDHQLPVVQDNGKAIALERGCALDLNTYFGSFYECYWLRYTHVTRTVFTFCLKGKALLRLFRYSPEIKEELLFEGDFEGNGNTCEIPVREPERFPTTHGRLYAQFLARENHTVLSDLCWRTPLAPPREVRLEATLCTYNRDKDLAKTMGNLALLQKEGLIQEISVINNAQKGLRERLEDLLPEHARGMAFELAEQPNIGGAGSMARSILDTLKAGRCNYLARFDDDIRVDPEIMRRLPLLLRYVKEHVAIGCPMLDSLKPTSLYESGALLRPEFLFIELLNYGLDACDSEELNKFARVDFVDYLPWWCFTVATKDLSPNALPLPFFIKADDIEFGPRLRKRGVENVSWAGLAVWHEPFYVKQDPHQFYYSYRNLMFAYAYHGIFMKRGALRRLRQIFLGSLLLFYYHRAWAFVRAMEDFLKGPELLANWTGESHRQLIAEEKLWSEKNIPRALTTIDAQKLDKTSQPPPLGFTRSFFAFFRLLSDLLRPAKPDAPLKFIDYWTQWPVWGGGGQNRIAVNHDRMDVCHVYRRDPRKVAKLLFRFWRAYFRILFRNCSLEGHPAMDRLTTEAFWRSRFNDQG